MRHAIVTGASTGIGRAAALALAQEGFEVWAGVRNDADATSVEADALHPLRLDVTDPLQVAEAAATVLAKSGGRLHALINNAGVAVSDPWEVVSDEDLLRQFEVNIFGLHRVTRTFLPAIIAAKGRIVNVGSISGRIGLPFMGPYVASKHALEGYNDSLRREVRHLGVKVSIIEPGMVDTPIWDKALPDGDDYVNSLPAHYRDVARQLLESTSEKAANEAIDPAEVAAVIVHAAKSRFAKARYALPMKEKVISRISAVLPEFLMDRAVDAELKRR